MSSQLLLMDLDDTVADRAGAFSHWLDVELARWAPDDDGARGFLVELDRGGTTPRLELLAAARSRFSLDDPLEQLLARHRALTLDGFAPVAPEVAQELQRMRELGWCVGVVSNGESGVQEATADRIGLMPLIDACVVSGTVGIRKPDPRIFELAAERCGMAAAGGWMIGDADVDVLGAARARMRSVWLSRGREWASTEATPDATAASFREALAIVVRA